MKVIIFGNSGSGKSTLAKKLVNQHDLSHLDLDTIAWQDTTPPKRLTIEVSREKILDFIHNCSSWVIEGCYSDLIEIATPLCSEMFFLNPGVEACIENCRKRPWEPHKYESPEAQDKNLAMLIEWVKQYEIRSDSLSLKAHQKVFDSFTEKKTEFN